MGLKQIFVLRVLQLTESINQKGLAPILIVIILAVLVGGYLIYQKQNKPILQQPAPTLSAANGKECEFFGIALPRYQVGTRPSQIP